VTEEQLAGCRPAYAAYVYAQNQVSVMSEQLTGLKEMAPFAHIVSEAEDLYMPSAPPNEPAHDLLLHLRRRTRWGRLQIHPKLSSPSMARSSGTRSSTVQVHSSRPKFPPSNHAWQV
jgi:hypothetical protein